MTAFVTMTGKPVILVILGATASGKSALAERVARHAGAEILSVDSMQVYRGMNIGTAKPTELEQAVIKHHLLDLVDPDQSFSVAKFVELADRVISQSDHPLIATGGTPLYYKVLFEGLFDGPQAEPALRARLAEMSNEALHQKLVQIDPVAAQRIHVNDSRRLVRALEVFEITGKPITSFQTDWSAPTLRHRAVFFGLSWDKDTLNRRINARVKEMIAAGWVEETRQLLARDGAMSQTAAEATGYRELIDHLNERISLADAIEQIKISTRQLARRQMKWFRRFANVRWLPGDRPIEENADHILKTWPVP